MSGPVKPARRRYDSSRRLEQARRTRTSVVQAAHQLFLERGFAATTMPEVASSAGVSVQTVYKAFRNKARLAKAVFDFAMAGDDEPVAMLERESLGRVRDEPDARTKLRLYGEFLAETAPRHVPVQLVIREAAATDPEARTVWNELQAERLKAMSVFARALHRDGHLRPGLSTNEARDVLWAYNSAELFQLLVLERGWSPRRYGRWAADALVAALLVTSSAATQR